MSRPPTTVIVPPAPVGVALDHAPRLDYDQASQWFSDALQMQVTARFIRSAAEKGLLRSNLLGAKRFMSTADLWEWATTKTKSKRSQKPRPMAPSTVGAYR